MTANFSLESAAEKLEPTLKAFQAHWKDILAKHEPLVEQARVQLTYVEGLLEGLSSLPNTNVSAVVEAPAIAKVKTPKKAPVIAVEETPAKAPKKAAKAAKKVSAPKASKGRASILQFTNKYVGKTLTAAVGQILNERDGQEVSIEDVVSVLYGELDSEQFKVAKDRVTKNLSKGKMMGLWDRVPEKSGYYTVSVKSLKL